MSWEGGVDLVALTPGAPMPNVIVHLARLVHTPFGSTPAGIVMLPDWDDVGAPPVLAGFVAGDVRIGAYFGAHIFADTPFEQAPVMQGHIEISIEDAYATAKVLLPDFVIETRLGQLSATYKVDRDAGEYNDLPFFQQGVERNAALAEIRVNGQLHPIEIPPLGLTGGPAAVVAPCGLYGR